MMAMRLAGCFRLVAALWAWGALLVGVVGFAVWPRSGAALLVGALALGAFLRTTRVASVAVHALVRRRYRRVTGSRDPAHLRRFIDEWRELWPTSSMDWAEATALLFEERWPEALELLAKVDRAKLDARARVAHDFNHSWCLTQLGRGDEAVLLAEAAMPFAEREWRATALTALGAAYQAAGRSAEAVRVLEEALRDPNPAPRSTAARAHHLGEALRALGRVGEARAAYQRAIDAAPASDFARRAAQAMAALPTAPHR